MTLGPLFCATCDGTELARSKRLRCAQCGGKRILTMGTLHATIIGYRRGQVQPPLGLAVKRLLREIGASWP